MSGIAHKILGNPEKYSVQELTQGVQSGVIPGYIGIPLIQDKMKKQKEAQAIAGGPQPDQPPIAAQVLAEAQGVPALASNLPEQMAGGGIVAFAGGGSAAKALFADDEEADDDYTDAIMGAMDSMDAMRSRIGALREAGISPSESSGLAALLPPHLGGTNDQSMQVAYSGPGAGMIDSMRSYFSKGQENTAPQAAPKQAQPSNFQNALNFILPHEGGYVNDRVDKGGPTKFGVTKNTLEGYLGKKVSIEDVQNMPIDLAKQIYKEQYWDKINGDKLDPKIAMLAFDTAVGSGVGKAKQMLSKYGDDPEKFLEAKKQWMKDIVSRDPSRKRFDKGWQNRMNNLGEYIQKMPSDSSVASMASGGVASLKGGGMSDIFDMSKDEIKDFMKRRLRMEQARAAFSGMPSAAAPVAEATAASPGIGSLISRAAVPLGLGTMAYDIGNKIMDKKQAEELAQYGAEGPPTDEELARASRPAFMRDVSMSPQVQQERGIKPLAPLSYTPAGVATYGPRLGYTPPMVPNNRVRADSAVYDRQDMDVAPAPEQIGPNGPMGADYNVPQGVQPLDSSFNSYLASQAAEKAPAQEDGLAGLRQQIAESLSGLKNQKEIDNYMALLSGGLGMLGGTSPFAAANIGRGAQQGIAAYQAAAQARGQDQRGLLSAQLGLERYGQLGALKNEQNALRKDLAAQEDTRKRELAGDVQASRAAALTERQRKFDEESLGKMEAQAEKLVESSGKLAALENIGKGADEIARARKRMIDDLLAQNKRYQGTYNRLYPGVADSFGTSKIRDYDVKTGQLR